MTLRFKNNHSKPLMLWCSSHVTLSKEEIPLYLEAGFRVIPLLTDFWTWEYRKSLDQELSNAWKDSVGLPADVVEKIQAISFCREFGRKSLDIETIELLNQHVDAIYLSVLPNLAIRLTRSFDGSVIFRPFGHADLQTYSRIAEAYDQPPSSLSPSANFIWCPILSTLQCAESRPMWRTPVHVGCFVTRERLETSNWSVKETDRVVLETLPRINKQDYYRHIYDEYIRDHGQLPLRILGGNDRHGGELNDKRIVGQLPDAEYHAAIRTSRICIYHGKSPYHVHYHPLEFMAVGVPVLFHANSAIAWEARLAGYSEEFLSQRGMYSSAVEANRIASRALESLDFAEELSQSQHFFMETLFSRAKALQQAIWLKTLVISQLNETRRMIPPPRILQSISPSPTTLQVVNPESGEPQQRPVWWGKRFERRIRRVRKQLLGRLKKAS